MSYHDRLTKEIHAQLDALAAERRPWNASWIAHAICNGHDEVISRDGPDGQEHADFWRHCGYQNTREEVRRCINQRAGERPDRDPSQPSLPGFDHLQAYYLVKRQGEEIGIPIFDLTDAEIEAKAELYRTMGKACFAHARELTRFKALRKPSAAA